MEKRNGNKIIIIIIVIIIFFSFVFSSFSFFFHNSLRVNLMSNNVFFNKS